MPGRFRLLTAALLTAVMVVGATAACGEPRPVVTVFAAASLADSLGSLADDYAATTGVDVRVSYGGSTTLAQQVLRGAPADLVIAAGAGPMDALAEAGRLAPGARVDLLGNTLVVVGPAGGVDAPTPAALLHADVRRIALADPALAPAGVYARQALQGLGVWDEVQSKLVYAPDVRTALQYARTGDVDAAVVYASDVIAAANVRVLHRVPGESHAPIVYPAAVITDADNAAGAAAFLAYLQSASAQETFRRHGFTTAP